MGFIIVGCVFLVALSSTLLGMLLDGFDVYIFASLIMAMFLPFVIGALSWRDLKEVQKKETQEFTREPFDSVVEKGNVQPKSQTHKNILAET
jgi:hypothetical protein